MKIQKAPIYKNENYRYQFVTDLIDYTLDRYNFKKKLYDKNLAEIKKLHALWNKDAFTQSNYNKAVELLWSNNSLERQMLKCREDFAYFRELMIHGIKCLIKK